MPNNFFLLSILLPSSTAVGKHLVITSPYRESMSVGNRIEEITGKYREVNEMLMHIGVDREVFMFPRDVGVFIGTKFYLFPDYGKTKEPCSQFLVRDTSESNEDKKEFERYKSILLRDSRRPKDVPLISITGPESDEYETLRNFLIYILKIHGTEIVEVKGNTLAGGNFIVDPSNKRFFVVGNPGCEALSKSVATQISHSSGYEAIILTKQNGNLAGYHADMFFNILPGICGKKSKVLLYSGSSENPTMSPQSKELLVNLYGEENIVDLTRKEKPVCNSIIDGNKVLIITDKPNRKTFA